MKSRSLTIILSCLSAFLEGQTNIIPNGNFENGSFTGCIYGTDASFGASSGNIANWEIAKHNNDKGEGQPDWLKHTVCPYQYEASSAYCSQLAGLFVNSNKYIAIQAKVFKCQKKIDGAFQIKKFHEAVCLSLPGSGTFNQYQYYKIRYKIIPVSTTQLSGEFYHPTCINERTNCHLRIFLSSGGKISWDHNSSTKQEIYNANFISNANSFCIWQVVERDFVVNEAGLKTLVLYAESGAFIIDDVEVFGACEPSYFVQNKNYFFEIYPPNSQNGNHFSEQSSDVIVAGNNVVVTNPIGDVNIKSGAAIVYTAQNKVTLKPGFKAETGSYFHATIAPCPNTIRSSNMFDNAIYYPINSDDSEDIDNSNLTIDVYPNPNTGTFTLEKHSKSREDSYIIRIYNIMGELIKSELGKNEKVEINLGEQPKGLYFIDILCNNSTSEKKKIIVN